MKLFEQPRGPETPGQWIKRYVKVFLFSCGIMILSLTVIFVCMLIFSHTKGSGSDYKNYDEIIVNARENFPAIQAELEEGIERLRPLLEEDGLPFYYFSSDPKSNKDYSVEMTTIAEDLMGLGEGFSNISYVDYSIPDTMLLDPEDPPSYDSDPTYFRFESTISHNGLIGITYIYQTELLVPYPEQLAENWYLHHNRIR